MATAAYPGAAGNTAITEAATFIPEIWSDEVVAAYKKHLVAANVFKKMSFKGKKGDTINIPKPTRGAASVKAASTAVTLIAATETNIPVLINKHYEYSRFIEDIVEVQALSSLRRFYTDDAGFALAKQVDGDLTKLFEVFSKVATAGVVGGTGTAMYEKAVIGSTGTTLYNGGSSNAADITDAGIRAMILQLDDADVPMDNRVMVIPPIVASDMLAINRYTEQQFIGNGDAIKTGKIGQIYGIDIYVSSACPTATSTDRVGAMFHKDALCLAEQVGVRSQTQYKQEYLGDLFTSDTLYGTAVLRHTAGVAFVVPGT